MIKTLSDKIVALTISTIQILMLGICTLFAVLTVDNSTHGGGGGGVTLNNIQISVGYWNSLAIVDGALYTWGGNGYGQLGLGDRNVRYVPTRVGVANNWLTVSAGYEYTLAINTAGELYAWGRNDYGQLGLGFVSATSPYIGVTIPTRVGEATNWKTVETGNGYTVAINTAGELYAWGRNNNGQLGLGDTTNRNVPTRVGEATNWETASIRAHSSFAINSAGELWAWGSNGNGELGDGTTTYKTSPVKIGTQTNWKTVSTGFSCTLAINTAGELYAWGRNNYGQLGLGDTTNRTVPTRVGEATNWVNIVSAYDHSHAINSLGELYAWGNNQFGVFGDGTVGELYNKSMPVRVGAESNWVSVFGDRYFMFGINSVGELYGWGSNADGRLGLGDTIARHEPTELIFGHNVAAPYSSPHIYTVSAPSATRVKIGSSYTFTITMNPNYTAPIVKLNTLNGKLNFSSIDNNIYTYTISNVVGNITATNFTVTVSRIK